MLEKHYSFFIFGNCAWFLLWLNIHFFRRISDCIDAWRILWLFLERSLILLFLTDGLSAEGLNFCLIWCISHIFFIANGGLFDNKVLLPHFLNTLVKFDNQLFPQFIGILLNFQIPHVFFIGHIVLDISEFHHQFSHLFIVFLISFHVILETWTAFLRRVIHRSVLLHYYLFLFLFLFYSGGSFNFRFPISKRRFDLVVILDWVHNSSSAIPHFIDIFRFIAVQLCPLVLTGSTFLLGTCGHLKLINPIFLKYRFLFLWFLLLW